MYLQVCGPKVDQREKESIAKEEDILSTTLSDAHAKIIATRLLNYTKVHALHTVNFFYLS
jgi:hypothetical protein